MDGAESRKLFSPNAALHSAKLAARCNIQKSKNPPFQGPAMEEEVRRMEGEWGKRASEQGGRSLGVSSDRPRGKLR